MTKMIQTLPDGEWVELRDQSAPRELLPCPFCGWHIVHHLTYDDIDEIICLRCEGSAAPAVWNRRAESASPETPRTTDEALSVDALAQFIRTIDGDNTMGAGTMADRICEKFAAPRTMAAQPAALESDAQCESRIARLMHAVEGECDGLAINADQAWKILDYVDCAPAAPVAQPCSDPKGPNPNDAAPR